MIVRSFPLLLDGTPEVAAATIVPRGPQVVAGSGKASATIRSMQELGTLTYVDYASIPADGLRRELVEGEIVVTPSPRTRHQDLVLEFIFELKRHIDEHGDGRVFVAPCDVVLSQSNVVQPDVVYVADSQLSIITEANIQGVPALLIEVVSESRYDRVRKRDLYARFGVPDYWIVDPEADRVEALILEGDRYGKPQIFEPGDTLEFRGLPGLALNLTKLFHRLNRS